MKETPIKLSSQVLGESESVIARQETNDCVVRALAAMSGSTYDQAHSYAREVLGRKNGSGVRLGILKGNIQKGMMGKSFTPVDVNTRYKCYGEMVERQMTVGTFFKKASKKQTFLIVVKGHIFCMKEGVVVGGNYNDVAQLRKRIIKAWLVE